jgi:hypothetical protein
MVLMVLTVGGWWAQKQTKPAQNHKSSEMSTITEVQSYVHFHGAPAKGKISWWQVRPQPLSKQAGP